MSCALGDVMTTVLSFQSCASPRLESTVFMDNYLTRRRDDVQLELRRRMPILQKPQG